MLGLGRAQSVLKVLHYIILTFDRTDNAWVFLDNPSVYLLHTKAKGKNVLEILDKKQLIPQ